MSDREEPFVFHDYNIEAIKIDWSRADELWKKFQLVIEEEKRVEKAGPNEI